MGSQTFGQAMERMNDQRSQRGLSPTKNIARTAAGHQIAYLVLLADLETSFAAYDVKLWGRVGKWQSAWRYESHLVDPRVAEEFLDDVGYAVKWLLSKIGALIDACDNV
jgi:hypothetical protein